LQTNVPLAQLG